MKRPYRYLSLILVVLIFGCSEISEQPKILGDESVPFAVKATTPAQTRTTINGTSLSWSLGDRIGLFIGTTHDNVLLRNTATDLDVFNGSVVHTSDVITSTTYRAYYPFVYQNDSDLTIEAVLPQTQTPPFDATANFMFADEVTARYDANDMPSISLEFNNQLFAIVKVSFTNSDSSYQDEVIDWISLSTPNKTLSGKFTFDIDNPLSTLAFSSDSGQYYNDVKAVYSTKPTLGLNTQRDIWLIVNPFDDAELTVTIRTENISFSVTTDGTISATRGDVTTLPLIDLASSHIQRVRKIVCWGDSFTHGNFFYAGDLQNFLGNMWKVYDGGISGDRTIEIAIRQGGIQALTGSAFTIPATKGASVAIDGIYSAKNDLNEDSVFELRDRWSAATRLVNPCIINGVVCTVTATSVTRVSESGSSVAVAANSPITTYAAANLKDADLIVIYMGANGGFNGDTDVLVAQHKAMINFQDNKKAIVMGYHSSIQPEYVARFTTEFGDHFIDLRKDVVDRAQELLIRTGAYATVADIPQSDLDRIAKGYWPYSFYTSTTDTHPNTYGERAIAILINERMQRLGYLEW